ncbi:MAG TPA: restriction endonuclease [Candidatus Nitrosotalea sp.]|nr:restriction endonuclease [Candidatus Nitrosotalea sp.]
MLNLQTLVRGIQGIIPGGLSVKDFSMVTQTSEAASIEILDNLMKNGIGTYKDNLVQFDESDRLKTSILAISMGAPVEEISRLLRWQDFESLAAEILESREFEISRNVIFTKPRMQIDVVGIKSGIAVLIDCKHWNRMSQYSLEQAVKKQVERTKRFVSEEKVRAAIPAIVTLHQFETKFIERVPIIPIFQLDAFCEEFYGNIEGLQP